MYVISHFIDLIWLIRTNCDLSFFLFFHHESSSPCALLCWVYWAKLPAGIKWIYCSFIVQHKMGIMWIREHTSVSNACVFVFILFFLLFIIYAVLYWAVMWCDVYITGIYGRVVSTYPILFAYMPIPFRVATFTYICCSLIHFITYFTIFITYTSSFRGATLNNIVHWMQARSERKEWCT